MNKIYNDIIIVDSSDKSIGYKQLPETARNGDITRVSRVFVFSSNNELLLQKRSKQVYAPGLLCESAAGHVDVGEDYFQAARRELKEEIGVQAELREVCHYYHEETVGKTTFNRFNTIFIAYHDGPFTIELEEVESVQFVGISELEQRFVDNPDQFPEGFIYAYYQYKKATNKG